MWTGRWPCSPPGTCRPGCSARSCVATTRTPRAPRSPETTRGSKATRGVVIAYHPVTREDYGFVADRDAEFGEFLDSRAVVMRRTAYLLCGGDWHRAED